MRVFDIYKHPRYGVEAVKRGFSWSAFLVPSVWAVRRGLGYTTVVLVITTTLMFDIAEVASHWIQQPAIQLWLLFSLHADRGVARDRADPSDSGAYGACRLSCGGRPHL